MPLYLGVHEFGYVSLEDGPSAVTKAFPCISLVILGDFY